MSDKPRSRAEMSVEQAALPPRWVRFVAYGLVAAGVLTCIGCGYVVYLIKPRVTEVSQEAEIVSKNILDFTPIEGYVPKGAVIWPMLSLLNLNAAYYEKIDDDGMLVLIEVGSDQLSGRSRVRSHLETILREKNGVSDALKVDPEVIREDIMVQGRLRTFELSHATDQTTRARYCLIEGIVSSLSQNPVYIGLRFADRSAPAGPDGTAASGSRRIPDDVRKMLGSIR